jgi:hypothetical protein
MGYLIFQNDQGYLVGFREDREYMAGFTLAIFIRLPVILQSGIPVIALVNGDGFGLHGLCPRRYCPLELSDSAPI